MAVSARRTNIGSEQDAPRPIASAGPTSPQVLALPLHAPRYQLQAVGSQGRLPAPTECRRLNSAVAPDGEQLLRSCSTQIPQTRALIDTQRHPRTIRDYQRAICVLKDSAFKVFAAVPLPEASRSELQCAYPAIFKEVEHSVPAKRVRTRCRYGADQYASSSTRTLPPATPHGICSGDRLTQSAAGLRDFEGSECLESGQLKLNDRLVSLWVAVLMAACGPISVLSVC